MTLLILLFTLWIPMAAMAATVANNKGWSGTNWFFAGLFFGPFGLLAAVGLPDRSTRQKLQQLIDLYTINL